MTRRKKDVLRFDVAVDDALSMCVGEGIGNVARNATCDVHVHLSVMIDSVAQRFARDIRHDVVEEGLNVSGVV